MDINFMDINFMECPITFKPCNYSGNCNKCPLVLDEVEEALKPEKDEDLSEKEKE